jgi:hypothetical protein
VTWAAASLVVVAGMATASCGGMWCTRGLQSFAAPSDLTVESLKGTPYTTEYVCRNVRDELAQKGGQ